MSRKHYIALAQVLHEGMLNKEYDSKTIANISQDIALVLRQDNPGFLFNRWDKAVLFGGK